MKNMSLIYTGHPGIDPTPPLQLSQTDNYMCRVSKWEKCTRTFTDTKKEEKHWHVQDVHAPKSYRCGVCNVYSAAQPHKIRMHRGSRVCLKNLETQEKAIAALETFDNGYRTPGEDLLQSLILPQNSKRKFSNVDSDASTIATCKKTRVF